MTATARADTDNYSKIATVPVTNEHIPITCSYPAGSNTPDAGTSNSTFFSFDISWVDQALGEYMLADSSHGFAKPNSEGGMLTGNTSGDLLVINTDDTGSGYHVTIIDPPRHDPFAGHRCDDNSNFGGLGTRDELSGPNGVYTVNNTQAWVGDGPSYFTPETNGVQTNTASDYRNDPCDSSVRVFNLISKKQIAHINVHGCFRTDEGAFDAVDQIALYANPSESDALRGIAHHFRPVDHSPFITLISTIARGGDDSHGDNGRGHYKILTQINFDGSNGTPKATGGIEQAVYSRQTGLFYIAIPANDPDVENDTDTVPDAVPDGDDDGVPDGLAGDNDDGWVTTVDPRPGHHFAVHSYPLATNSCPGGPAGAALGPTTSGGIELLLGCGGASPTPGEVVVNIDPQTGVPNTTTAAQGSTAALTVLPDGSQSCDEVAYDAATGHFGGACFTTKPGRFNLLVNDAHSLTFDTSIGGNVGAGAFGAHSITADSTEGEFWMPMFQSSASPFTGNCGGADQACVGVYGGDNSDWAE